MCRGLLMKKSLTARNGLIREMHFIVHSKWFKMYGSKEEVVSAGRMKEVFRDDL